MNVLLNQWLTENAARCCYENFIEVHIDDLDDTLKNPDEWISGVQRLLTEGNKLLAAGHGWPCVLAGCISLRSSFEAIGINFSNETDLRHELNITPPSLYIFKRNNEPWKQNNHKFIHSGSSLKFNDLHQMLIMYLEYEEPTEIEFRRSLWLVPSDSADIRGDSSL
jgi:hypothetical protein